MTAATSDAVVLASSMEALLRALPRPLLSPALESALAAAGATPARAQQALAAIVKDLIDSEGEFLELLVQASAPRPATPRHAPAALPRADSCSSALLRQRQRRGGSRRVAAPQVVWLLSSLAGARAAPAHAPAALAALLAPSMLTAAGRPRAPAAVDPRVAAALECFIQHYDAILEGQVCEKLTC